MTKNIILLESILLVSILLGRHIFASVREVRLLLNASFVVDGNFTFNSDVSSMIAKDLLFLNSYPRYMPMTVRPN